MKKQYIKIPLDDKEFFNAVLTCAVRYCIGRMTYMPGLVTDWIMEHCEGLLTNRTVSVMIEDIDRAASHDNLGMSCDVDTWMKFRKWLTTQVKE